MRNNNFKYLVTGAAGFIGFHLCKKLILSGEKIIGFDNLNSYYDVSLKDARLRELYNLSKTNKSKWEFIKGDLEDIQSLREIFLKYNPDIVINLAAQAGVRYSIEKPLSYIGSNIVGFVNILECCREFKTKNFIFASSSSVYGGNQKVPFHEDDTVDHPINIYAATKKSNELLAHSYSHLYGIPTTGLRFFTVYGPWGRPDMAPMIFTKAILDNKKIKVFNFGEMSRDFTYIDDVINSVFCLLDKIPTKNPNFDFKNLKPSESWAPYRILNIGNSKKITLLEFLETLESILGKKANKEFLPIQKGEIENTISDTEKINLLIKIKKTNLKDGLTSFVKWYRDYYKK